MKLPTIKAKQAQRGFTIVELLIVIVVIGVLAGIVIVAYTGVTKKANQSAAIGNATSVQKVAESYNSENGYYPSLANLQSYSGYSRIPNGISLGTLNPTATDNKGTYMRYKEKGTSPNFTGGCIIYWDDVTSAVANPPKFVGDASSWNAGTSTCG